MGKHRTKTGIRVRREPTGRLARDPIEHEPAPAKLRRLYLAALADMADHRWATELGRLYRNGRITETQFLAGERWHDLARRYHRAIAAPPGVRSPALDFQIPGRSREHSAEEQRTIAAMHSAHAALAGAHRVTVRLVCEHDQMCAAYELPDLKAGLDALAAHFGLPTRATNGKLQRFHKHVVVSE